MILTCSVLVLNLGGCALPKPQLTKSRTYSEFIRLASSPPQFQWAYCGSDSSHHYFAQWRYGAVLLTMGQSSFLN